MTTFGLANVATALASGFIGGGGFGSSSDLDFDIDFLDVAAPVLISVLYIVGLASTLGGVIGGVGDFFGQLLETLSTNFPM